MKSNRTKKKKTKHNAPLWEGAATCYKLAKEVVLDVDEGLVKDRRSDKPKRKMVEGPMEALTVRKAMEE